MIVLKLDAVVVDGCIWRPARRRGRGGGGNRGPVRLLLPPAARVRLSSIFKILFNSETFIQFTSFFLSLCLVCLFFPFSGHLGGEESAGGDAVDDD